MKPSWTALAWLEWYVFPDRELRVRTRAKRPRHWTELRKTFNPVPGREACSRCLDQATDVSCLEFKFFKASLDLRLVIANVERLIAGERLAVLRLYRGCREASART